MYIIHIDRIFPFFETHTLINTYFTQQPYSTPWQLFSSFTSGPKGIHAIMQGMAIGVVEFSREGYKIRKVFAKEST